MSDGAGAGITVSVAIRTRNPRGFPPVGPWEKSTIGSRDEVAGLVAGLDGETRTEVAFARRAPAGLRSDGVGLDVSGGGGRVLVLYLADDDDGFPAPWCMVEDAQGEAPEARPAGPVSIVLASRRWVAQDRAVRAAMTFFDDGRMDAAFQWEPYPGPLETRAQ